MSPPILLWQTPRFSIPFQIQLVHTCASLPHSEARAFWLWVVITLGFLGVAGVKGHVTVQGYSISENDQQGHHNAACPRDGTHGWVSCDHISCWCRVPILLQFLPQWTSCQIRKWLVGMQFS